MRLFSFTIPNTGGRNNTGRITVRHRGAPVRKRVHTNSFGFCGNVYKKYRLLRFSVGNKLPICIKTKRNSYNVSLLSNRFFFKATSVKPNKYSLEFSIAKLYMIPIGMYVYNLQVTPIGGPVFARANGSYAQLLKRRGSFATVRLPSGEVRRVNAKCWALASSSNRIYVKDSFYKAGQNRNLGIRPSVRGCAMNPVDHPHGGRTGESRPSVSPWAQLTKGFRTRVKPINARVVLTSVQKLKK